MTDQQVLPPRWQLYESSPNDRPWMIWVLATVLIALIVARWLVWGF